MKKARRMLIVSMTVFGTIGLFVRGISVSSGELALYRAVLAAGLLGVYFLVSGQKIPIHSLRKEIPLLLFSGVAMGINWILLFEAYKYTTISAATLSYYFAPVIVTVVCPFLFKEKLGAKQIICFVMSTVGLILIVGVGEPGGMVAELGSDSFDGAMSGVRTHNLGAFLPYLGSRNLVGILLGLGAAVFYATVILLNKFIKGVEGIHRTFLQFLSAIVILVPYVACTGGIHLSHLDIKGWVCLLVVGLFHTGITYCMYFSALKELPGQKAAILSYIDPLVAVLVSVWLLHEEITVLQLAGGGLILGFTLWNEMGMEGKKENR